MASSLRNTKTLRQSATQESSSCSLCRSSFLWTALLNVAAQSLEGRIEPAEVDRPELGSVRIVRGIEVKQQIEAASGPSQRLDLSGVKAQVPVRPVAELGKPLSDP